MNNNEWDERFFFEKARTLRDNIKKSDSPDANLCLSILTQIVEQVFISSEIPEVLLLSPLSGYSRAAFYNAVKKIFKKLKIKHEFKKKIISSANSKTNYAYAEGETIRYKV